MNKLNISVTIIVSIISITLLYFDRKYNFLGDGALGLWTLPCLFNISLLKYILTGKDVYSRK